MSTLDVTRSNVIVNGNVVATGGTLRIEGNIYCTGDVIGFGTSLTTLDGLQTLYLSSDWNAQSGPTVILNKPDLATVATSGSYNDLSNKPVYATVATTGSYNDLINRPSNPSSDLSQFHGTAASGPTIFGTSSFSTTINGTSLIIQNPQTISATSTHTANQTGIVQTMIVSCTSESGTPIGSTTPVASFRVPFTWNILGARASYTNDSDSSPPTSAIVIDIRYSSTPIINNTQGTSIFTASKLNIDANRYTTVGSTTVINNGRLAGGLSSITVPDDNVISIFVETTSSGASGLKVCIYYTL